MRVWSLSNENNTSILLKQKQDNRCNTYVESTRCLAMKREPVWEDGFWARQESVQSWSKRFAVVTKKKRSIEVQVPSLFQDNTVSWVRIVNGVDRYVTESMPTAKEENTAPGTPIAKAKPRQKPTVTLSSISIPVLERIWIDIETQRSNDHKCIEVSKATTRLLRHDQSVPLGNDGGMHCNDVIEECRRKKFDDASQWLFEDWISKLAKGGGAKKRFQYCGNPNSSNQVLYLRAIQGHSGESAIDPALQDKRLIPKGFTEYLYHVGNANELNSIIRNGLIPGTSLNRGRQAVFFTTVNPMEDGYGLGETPCALTKTRIASYRTFGHAFKIQYFGATLEVGQRCLQLHQTRSHALILYNTLPAACMEKAVCMKSTDELYQKVRLTPRVPRVVLKSNSQCCVQDPQNQDARSSREPSSDSKSYGETCDCTWTTE